MTGKELILLAFLSEPHKRFLLGRGAKAFLKVEYGSFICKKDEKAFIKINYESPYKSGE